MKLWVFKGLQPPRLVGNEGVDVFYWTPLGINKHLM